MKKLSVLGSLALLVCCLAWVGAASGNTAAVVYSTEVSIEPTGKDEFVLRTIVKDVTSGEVVAGPSIKMLAGQTANAESTFPDGGSVSLTAMIEGGKHSATYSVVVTRGDRVLSQHSAKIAL